MINWKKYDYETNLKLKLGTLIKYSHEDGDKIGLSGDCNTVGGVCDCCKELINYYSEDFVDKITEIMNIAKSEL